MSHNISFATLYIRVILRQYETLSIYDCTP